MSLDPEEALRSPAAMRRWRRRHDAAVPMTEAQALHLRHRRPAAARHDRFVLCGGLFGRLRGRRRQRRQRRLRHHDGAGGGIESLTEVALLVFPDQRLQDGVFGRERVLRKCGTGNAARKLTKHAPPVDLCVPAMAPISHGFNTTRNRHPARGLA